jgi:hypothetical protein
MATNLAKNTITLTAVMTEYVVKEADGDGGRAEV